MTTVADLHRAYRDGVTTPTAVAERFLAADPVVGTLASFRAVDADDVMAQAAASTTRWGDGAPVGPLDGVLVGIKDFFAVRGYRTFGGTRALSVHGEAEATLVTRLRAAGAIIAGKTHTTELGLSPTGTNTAQPTPRNPHDLTRLPGGSSSGTGAAVAAGLVTAGVGSDGGGSIRIPAATCGVFGHKPSWDLVPTDGSMHVGWFSLDHVGPLARSTADLVTMVEVLADTRLPVSDAPLRWGVDWSWWGTPDPAVDGPCRAVAAELRPTEVALDRVDLAPVAGYVTAISELVAGMWEVLDEQPDALSPDVVTAMAQAPNITGADYVRAQQVRAALADSFAAVFADVDVLVVPTVAVPAPARPTDQELSAGVLDSDLIAAMTAYTFPANLCGLPAASVPVGVTQGSGSWPRGLPVGLQVIGPRGGDAMVLSACAALERAGLAVRPHPVAEHATLDP
ncbi:amidase [Euzebya tangerina]|uniref:amidase n=1 Tax=Euzebya tangerina TaxID=591198 RepID=UPI000E316D27|nr:amidase [Euzebya tangerina]